MLYVSRFKRQRIVLFDEEDTISITLLKIERGASATVRVESSNLAESKKMVLTTVEQKLPVGASFASISVKPRIFKVTFGVNAPSNVTVFRGEIFDQLMKNTK